MSKVPSTPATRLLKEQGVSFKEHLYRYEDHGGTHTCARELGVDEHAVIKTLILEDESGKALIMLQHGDWDVSTKVLARTMGAKSLQLCKPEVANKHSGYLVGGTSPFGTKKSMPVYMERSIADLPLLWINGGSRGFLVSLEPKELLRVLKPVMVEASQKP